MQLIIWSFSNSADPEQWSIGDVVETLEDAAHAGQLIVQGAWNNACISSVYGIIDVSGTVEQVRSAFTTATIAEPALAAVVPLKRVANVDVALLPASAQTDLAIGKRCSVTLSEFLAASYRRPIATDEWLAEQYGV